MRLFRSSPGEVPPLTTRGLARAQVVRGNDPQENGGRHIYSREGAVQRELYREEEKLFWQPAAGLPKDVVARW